MRDGGDAAGARQGVRCRSTRLPFPSLFVSYQCIYLVHRPWAVQGSICGVTAVMCSPIWHTWHNL